MIVMINRTKINNSLYNILDDSPQNIRKYQEETLKKTQKQRNQEIKKRNQKSNIIDINLNENLDNQNNNPFNQVIVHTESDNLIHNYFHHFSLYWDAGDPLSGVILKLPKIDKNNTKYWITYNGEVTIYLGSDANQIRQQQNDNDITINNSYWKLKGMIPIFRGELGVIKEYQKILEIHIDSIGKRFKQKIPEEFRQAFIYNQNVRDAFQAICEFLGVKYICPPAQQKPQDNEQENNTPQNDGTENNVDNKNSQEQQLAQAASQVVDEASQKIKDSSQNNESNSTQGQNSDSQSSLNTATQQTDVQNGYSDISFDSNGAIIHGSVAIETSPDMEETLLALDEHPLDKYLEDTTYISTDVKRFLNGEMFETVHDFAMLYDAITIEPKSSSTSDMSIVSNVGGTTGENNESNNGNGSSESQYGDKILSQGKTGITLNGVKFTNTKQALTYGQVNALTPKQARNEMVKTNQYYNTTILRLRARARGYHVSDGTPYYKFTNG